MQPARDRFPQKRKRKTKGAQGRSRDDTFYGSAFGLSGKTGISEDGPLQRFATACTKLIDASIVLPQPQSLRKALKRRATAPSYFRKPQEKSMTACIRLLDQMPRSIEMELNEIGQCMISGNSGPREHEPVSAIRSKAENISSFRVLPPVTRSGHPGFERSLTDGTPGRSPGTPKSDGVRITTIQLRIACRCIVPRMVKGSMPLAACKRS